MVRGIDSFRDWFLEYQEQYAVIGGTACDLLMDYEGLDFRATKDINLKQIGIRGKTKEAILDQLRAIYCP